MLTIKNLCEFCYRTTPLCNTVDKEDKQKSWVPEQQLHSSLEIRV